MFHPSWTLMGWPSMLRWYQNQGFADVSRSRGWGKWTGNSGTGLMTVDNQNLRVPDGPGRWFPSQSGFTDASMSLGLARLFCGSGLDWEARVSQVLWNLEALHWTCFCLSLWREESECLEHRCSSHKSMKCMHASRVFVFVLVKMLIDPKPLEPVCNGTRWNEQRHSRPNQTWWVAIGEVQLNMCFIAFPSHQIQIDELSLVVMTCPWLAHMS